MEMVKVVRFILRSHVYPKLLLQPPPIFPTCCRISLEHNLPFGPTWARTNEFEAKRFENFKRRQKMHQRFYCQATLASLDKKLNPTGTEKKKLTKSPPVEKVFLISESDDISEVTLLEAEKISKKKGLQLIKVDDTKGRLKTDKKVYQLMSNAQYFGDEWRTKKKKDSEGGVGEKPKEDKSLVIKSKITQHDLESKIKTVKKLVDKGHNVRIFIEEIGGTGSSLDNAEIVYASMEKSLKESARIVQKRSKGSEIRFQVIPPKVTDTAGQTPAAKTKDKVVELSET